MSNCASIIRILEDHPSRLNKEGIIESEAKMGNTQLFEGYTHLVLRKYQRMEVPMDKDCPGRHLKNWLICCIPDNLLDMMLAMLSNWPSVPVHSRNGMTGIAES